MTKKSFIPVIIIFIILFGFGVMHDVYDLKHRHIEECPIVYQHDNSKEGWQKYPTIRFKYEDKEYETNTFHDYIDLSKTKGLFYIYIDNNGKVYGVEFNSYK